MSFAYLYIGYGEREALTKALDERKQLIAAKERRNVMCMLLLPLSLAVMAVNVLQYIPEFDIGEV